MAKRLSCPTVLALTIGVDLGVQPGHVPPIIEKRPCIYHILPPFPNNLVRPPNIFEKSTPLALTTPPCRMKDHVDFGWARLYVYGLLSMNRRRKSQSLPLLQQPQRLSQTPFLQFGIVYVQ